MFYLRNLCNCERIFSTPVGKFARNAFVSTHSPSKYQHIPFFDPIAILCLCTQFVRATNIKSIFFMWCTCDGHHFITEFSFYSISPFLRSFFLLLVHQYNLIDAIQFGNKSVKIENWWKKEMTSNSLLTVCPPRNIDVEMNVALL